MTTWPTQGRFVLLRHELPANAVRGSHWDWMFDTGESLVTWATEVLPSGTSPPSDAVLARALPDHRRAYLTYEGPVRGDRGTVTRSDEGSYEVLDASPQQVRLRLRGGKWRGVCELVHDEGASEFWQLRWCADEP